MALKSHKTSKKQKPLPNLSKVSVLKNGDLMLASEKNSSCVDSSEWKQCTITWIQRAIFYAVTHNDSFDNKSWILKNDRENVIMGFCSKSNEGSCDNVFLEYIDGQYIWIFESNRESYSEKSIKYRNDFLVYIVLTTTTKLITPDMILSYQAQDALTKFFKVTNFKVDDYQPGYFSALTPYEALLYSIFVDEQKWNSQCPSYWKEVKFGHPLFGANYKVFFSETGELDILHWSFFGPARSAVQKFITWNHDSWQKNPYVIKN